MSAKRPPAPAGAFNARLMAVLGGLAFLCFAWAFQVALTSPDESRDAEGDDLYGRGPFGFRGLMETLAALDVPVRAHRRALSGLDGGDFVLVTLPMLETDARPSLRAALDEWRGGDALLVLPKWQRLSAPEAIAATDADPETLRVRALPEADLTTLLRDLGFRATVTGLGPGAAGAVRLHGEGDGDAGVSYDFALRVPRGFAEAGAPGQALEDGPRCVLTSAQGCLAVQVLRRDRSMTLLADPDLLDNYGLLRAQNGPLSVALLDHLRQGAPVVFEASLHGYTVPELWSSLLRPPLLYPTLQLALMAGLWALAGSRRFGAPLVEPPTLGAGRQVLVENTVELLHQGGHSAHMLVRYWQATVRDLARQQRLPGEDHAARLLALGRALHRLDDLRALDADVTTAAARRLDTRAIARLANRIHGLRAPREGRSAGANTKSDP